MTLSFLLLPLIAIFLHGDLAAGIRSEEARAALWLSLQLSLVSLAVMVVVGTPLAYLLATRSFPEPLAGDDRGRAAAGAAAGGGRASAC